MSTRPKRLAAELLKEISQILREELHLAQLGFVTLLEADVSKDLRNARIFYSVMGTDLQKTQSEEALKNATKEIQWLVNERFRLRYAVLLEFVRDTRIDEGMKIQGILDKLNAEKKEKDERDSSRQ